MNVLFCTSFVFLLIAVCLSNCKPPQPADDWNSRDCELQMRMAMVTQDDIDNAKQCTSIECTGDWDLSNVDGVNVLCQGSSTCSQYNQDLSKWDISGVSKDSEVLTAIMRKATPHLTDAEFAEWVKPTP